MPNGEDMEHRQSERKRTGLFWFLFGVGVLVSAVVGLISMDAVTTFGTLFACTFLAGGISMIGVDK
jgi:hypothetical protein